MRRQGNAKIIATLGPASSGAEAGADMAQLVPMCMGRR